MKLRASLIFAPETHLNEPPHASREQAIIFHVLRLDKSMREIILLREPVHLILDPSDRFPCKDSVSVSVNTFWTRQEAIDHGKLLLIDFPPSCAHCYFIL